MTTYMKITYYVIYNMYEDKDFIDWISSTEKAKLSIENNCAKMTCIEYVDVSQIAKICLYIGIIVIKLSCGINVEIRRGTLIDIELIDDYTTKWPELEHIINEIKDHNRIDVKELQVPFNEKDHHIAEYLTKEYNSGKITATK